MYLLILCIALASLAKVASANDHCALVRDSLFTPAELLNSVTLKDQWCSMLPLYNRGFCNRGGHKHFNLLGPIGPKCKLPLESYGTGDFEKRVCGLKILQQETVDHKCIVIGVGSNNEWEFEEAIYDKTNCKIVTLDCYYNNATIPPRIADRTTFLPICLGARDANERGPNDKPDASGNYKLRPFVTYATLLNKIGLKHSPTFLKMDIEGFEYDVVGSILQNKDLLPLQIAMEIHNHRGRDLPHLLNVIHGGGYDIIDRHDNPFCDACTEVVIAKTRCEGDTLSNLNSYCGNKRHNRQISNFTAIWEASKDNKHFHECVGDILKQMNLPH
jgi:hypothetical protein